MNPETEFKSKLVVLIGQYFGNATATLYEEAYSKMPVEFVEKSSEKLLTEHLGSERARGLIQAAKQR